MQREQPRTQNQTRTLPVPFSLSQAEYGSDVVVDLMRAYGIEYVALNPGATYRAIHDSIVNYGGNTRPESILCCHEEIAVAVAHGYAKASGKPMVAFVHDIVGLQHASMAMYNAWCDRVPILVFGGTGPMDLTIRRPWIDWIHTAQLQGNLVRDFVKWDHQPHNLASVPESFVRAYNVATSEPQAPVYLCFDSDVQEIKLDQPLALPDPSRFPRPTALQADLEALRRLAGWLVEAEHPVLYADSVGRHPESVPVLVELAELLALPVLDRGNRFNFPNTHPLDLTGAERELLEQADLVLGLDMVDLFGALGTRMKDRGAFPQFLKPGAKLAHISMGDLLLRSWAEDYGRLQALDMNILADTAQALPQLLAYCRELLAQQPGRREAYPQRAADLAARHAALRAGWQAEARQRAAEQPIAVSRLASELWDAVKDEDWALVNGNLNGWTRRLWDWTEPAQYLGPSGGGGLGYGLGASIGAALAHLGTGKLCVNIQSDGDMLFTPSALWTAAHHRIPLLVVMYNNRAYHNDEEHQELIARVRGRPVENKGVGIWIRDPNVDFANLARSYGLHGEGPIEDPEAIRPALERALRVVKEERRLALVDVVTQSR